MNKRKIIVGLALGFIIAIALLSLYFFSHKPGRPQTKYKKPSVIGQVSGNIKFASESKGVINWEIRARVAKNLDKPKVELEGVEGEYHPRPGDTVFFKGTRGELDRDSGIGMVENVEMLYKNEYKMTTSTMNFDMNKSTVTTAAPVRFEGKKFTIMGVGLHGDIKEQVVELERDVNGTIERDKGKFRFSSDHFTYLVKENTYIFEGQVMVKGQDLNLLCDKVFVRSTKDNSLERIDALGRVKILSKGAIAKSEQAVYYFKEEKVMLSKSPKITRDNVEMEGELVTYDLSTGKFLIEKPKMIIEQRSR